MRRAAPQSGSTWLAAGWEGGGRNGREGEGGERGNRGERGGREEEERHHSNGLINEAPGFSLHSRLSRFSSLLSLPKSFRGSLQMQE